ncbi:unnamed protein product [Fraxinus pennsylvanica]|uniref:SKP1-like protein n=1 Tax=Fraxinus pennsylvanica TaxID=56036 RepID=A0AAD1YQQ0_9LAMI|nr:unnamed protein product [Fraxinus pennsylvanica]
MSSSGAEIAGKKLTLRSSDGEVFEVEEVVALASQSIKHMVEDDCADNVIPLPNVTGKILSKIIEYCKKHADAASAKADDKVSANDDDLRAFDADFVKVDQGTLFDLILAANYLDIKSLLDLTCQTVADMIKGKTPEDIRKTFNIKNDFTPEEEEEVASTIVVASIGQVEAAAEAQNGLSASMSCLETGMAAIFHSISQEISK